MARNTIYTLYKTGRIDPTLTNIWAFKDPAERETWLESKPALEFTANKYWRVGSPIKIPVSYETSFEYDYVRIINDGGTSQERVWYSFIAARAYISPSVTILTLDVDYIQTYYFDNQVPFWDVPGFIVKSTGYFTPLPGSASDYPVPQSITEAFLHESGNYAFIIYSTIAPASVTSGSPLYQGMSSDGVYSAACAYVVGGANAPTALNTLVSNFNKNGYTDAIAAIYAVPERYINPALRDGSPHDLSTANALVSHTITAAHTPEEYQYYFLLGDYDYTYIVVNNGQGETEVYHYYEFNGYPQFLLQLSITGGCPTLYFTPTNLKYHSADAPQQRTLKITQAISCVYLNDSYKIWLAQTQNSRAAAMEGANLAIAQAQEARSKSWAYQFGGIVERAEEQARDPLTGMLADTIGMTGEMLGADMGNIGISSVGRRFTDSDTGIAALDAPVHTYGSRYRDLQSGLKTGYDLVTRYMNHQLGIETRYTYDHAVAKAQQSLNELVAGWRDKARIPGTARGSNAYGDMAKFRQYGFMVATFAPAPEVMDILNKMIGASGFTVNRYDLISDYHTVFDYYQVNSAKIAVNPSVRPEFVRKMMLDVLQRGVYFWYINNGDISPFIGSPFGLNNPDAT